MLNILNYKLLQNKFLNNSCFKMSLEFLYPEGEIYFTLNVNMLFQISGLIYENTENSFL